MHGAKVYLMLSNFIPPSFCKSHSVCKISYWWMPACWERLHVWFQIQWGATERGNWAVCVMHSLNASITHSGVVVTLLRKGHARVTWNLLGEGAYELHSTNNTKVHLWWCMAFQFEQFPVALTYWILSTVRAFSRSVDWCELHFHCI